MHIPDGSRLRAVRRQHDRKIRRQERLWSELLANQPDVLGCREIGIGASGALSRQPDHSRTEGGENNRGKLRFRTAPRRLHHLIQVIPHRGDRPGVIVPAGGDRGGVTDAQTKDESIGPRLG